jgi:6-phosphofructo-2-kinase
LVEILLQILEGNMRLKLSGPDYKGNVHLDTEEIDLKDMDPVAALEDFKKRVANYERAYEPIGEDEEEDEDLQYCKVLLSRDRFQAEFTR